MDIQESSFLQKNWKNKREKRQTDHLFNAFSYDSINCVRFKGYKSQSVFGHP